MSAGILAILGAPDPEMQAIESLLNQIGATVLYATAGGRRVHAGNAYAADGLSAPLPAGGVMTVLVVECGAALVGPEVIRCDHHRPGDVGYGRSPAEFLAASSIGQVLSALLRAGVDVPLPRIRNPLWTGRRLAPGEYAAPSPDGNPAYVAYVAGVDNDTCVIISAQVPHDDGGTHETAHPIVLCAAADHCLAAAYRGECPGVDPDALMTWRVESRATFQRRPVAEVLADVGRARTLLLDADDLFVPAGPMPGGEMSFARIRDMRGQHVPELPEASAREGVCFVADGLPSPDGRVKVVCQSGSPEQIQAFIGQWAPKNGLVDIYGDPQRGFAGGYLRGAP